MAASHRSADVTTALEQLVAPTTRADEHALHLMLPVLSANLPTLQCVQLPLAFEAENWPAEHVAQALLPWLEALPAGQAMHVALPLADA